VATFYGSRSRLIWLTSYGIRAICIRIFLPLKLSPAAMPCSTPPHLIEWLRAETCHGEPGRTVYNWIMPKKSEALRCTSVPLYHRISNSRFSDRSDRVMPIDVQKRWSWNKKSYFLRRCSDQLHIKKLVSFYCSNSFANVFSKQKSWDNYFL